MANSILSSLVSQASFKLYDASGNSVLTGVKVKGVKVSMPGRLMKNMGEDGRPIIDTKIILPISVTVSAFADSTQAISKINDLLLNTTGRFTIYSRGLYFKGLTLASERFVLSGEYLSATPVDLTFKGIMKQGDSSVVAAQSGDASTVIGGIINTVSSTASKITSMAASLF